MTDGTPTPVGGEFLINTMTAGNQDDMAAAVLADGRIVVTWRTVETSYARILDANGVPTGPEFVVGHMWEPVITVLKNGGFVIAGLSSGDTIVAQIFDAEANSVGDVIQVDPIGGAQQPHVDTLTDGGFVVTWAGGGDGDGLGIFGQRYDALGDKLGDTFQVNTQSIGNQNSENVAALTDGGFVVVWDSNNDPNGDGGYGVYGQLFNADGSKAGGEFQVYTTTFGGAGPAVASLADGGFVSAWVSRVEDGSVDLFAQRFDAHGNKIGTEIQINTETTGNQYREYVTGLPDGGFMVTWTDTGSGTFLLEGQRFDADGNKVGTEFQITNDLADQYYSPAVVLLNGEILVTWTANHGGNYDIDAQIYSLPDLPPGPGETWVGGNGGDTHVGTSGNDSLTGGNGNDVISGGGGDDTILGGNGNDVIDGGIGNNQLSGGNGNDLISAGNGTNMVDGGNGDDVITVGNGSNNLSGGSGNDLISAGNGNNVVDGGNGNDVITVGNGNNNLSGGSGNDILKAGNGNNLVDGGNGSDIITVGNGNNNLSGGSGNDIFYVGTGDNSLTGGNGNDTFVFGPGFGKNVVTDFSQGDHVNFTGGVFVDFAAVQAAMQQVGEDVVVTLDSDSSITLQHVLLSHLHASDFAFV